MTAGIARPILLRLFAEGIEIPCMSAQVTVQPNAPAQCVLQVPPSSLGIRLLPRTVIHLFFLDSLETAASVLTYRGDARQAREQRPSLYEVSKQRANEFLNGEELEREERNHRYKLLFGGEFVGFGTQQSATSRSLVLQCLDFTNYWDYAYQFNNTDIFGPGIKAVLAGGATNAFTDFLSSPGEITAALLRLPSANYPALKGVMGGMIRMIEAIGGCYQQGTRFEGQNTFFSVAELRLRISQMITAYPDDKSVTRLLGGGSPDGIFGRSLGNLGEQVSIRTVFNAIARMLYLETASITSPLFVPGSHNNVKGRNPRKLSSLPQYHYISVIAAQGGPFCDEMVAAVEGTPAWDTPQKTYQEKNLLLRRLRTMQTSIGKVRGQAALDRTLSSTQNRRARVLLTSIAQKLSLVTARVQGRWSPGTKKGPITAPITKELGAIKDLFRQLYDLEIDASDAKTRTPQRLNAAIVRPNVWFSAPPRCNVLFPHHLLARSYQRNLLREPTRLLLKTHDEFFGEDELFDKYIFAPRSRTTKGKRHKGTLQELFNRDIMVHELYTGILPIFTKMGEFNILAVRGPEEWKKKPRDRPKISLAQRTANYLYYEQVFASRSMHVDAVFNPWIAPGFPGLIFDRQVSVEDVKAYQKKLKAGGAATEERYLMGTHYLGNFSQVTHQASPMQAQTSIEVQYPREYAETTEFLGGAVSDDQVVIKRFGTDAVRNHTVAALEKPRVGGIGLFYGVIEEVVEVSDGVEGMVFPVYTGPRRIGDTSEDGQAVVGKLVRLSEASPTLARKIGDKEVTFRAFRIKEAIPRYRRDKVDLPAEEAIRPGWYDDVWHPSKIGLAYQHFFQTGSITDATQVADADGAKGPVDVDKDARDRLAEDASGRKVGDQTEGLTPALLSLDQDASIEQAVDYLLAVFAYISENNLNLQKFMDAYTWRPIASIPDLFGTSDLELDDRGIEVVKGIEGIHSRAFGPYTDLFGLVTPEVETVLGASKTSQARRLTDVRGPRHAAVLAYREAVRQHARKATAGQTLLSSGDDRAPEREEGKEEAPYRERGDPQVSGDSVGLECALGSDPGEHLEQGSKPRGVGPLPAGYPSDAEHGGRCGVAGSACECARPSSGSGVLPPSRPNGDGSEHGSRRTRVVSPRDPPDADRGEDTRAFQRDGEPWRCHHSRFPGGLRGK